MKSDIIKDCTSVHIMLPMCQSPDMWQKKNMFFFSQTSMLAITTDHKHSWSYSCF